MAKESATEQSFFEVFPFLDPWDDLFARSNPWADLFARSNVANDIILNKRIDRLRSKYVACASHKQMSKQAKGKKSAARGKCASHKEIGDAKKSKATEVDDANKGAAASDSSSEEKKCDEKDAVNNDNDNKVDCGVTAKDYVKAGLIASVLDDGVSFIESRPAIRQYLPTGMLMRTAYGAGKNVVLQKAGKYVADQTENISLGILDKVLDVPVSNGVAGWALQFGTQLTYSLVKSYVLSYMTQGNAAADNDGNDDADDDDDVADNGGNAVADNGGNMNGSQWHRSNMCVLCQRGEDQVRVNVGFRNCNHVILCGDCYQQHNDIIVPGIPCYLCRAVVAEIQLVQ